MIEAFERYTRILSMITLNGRRNRKSYHKSATTSRRQKYRNDPLFSGTLDELVVTLTSECESVPYHDMDESCNKK